MRKKNFHTKWPKRFYLYVLVVLLCLSAPLLGEVGIIGTESPLITSFYGSLITLVAFPITVNEIILLRNYQMKMAEALENSYRKTDTNILIKRIEKLQGVMESLANEMNSGRVNGKRVRNLATLGLGEYKKVRTILRGNEYIQVSCEGEDRTRELSECLIFVHSEKLNKSDSVDELRKNIENLLAVEVNLESLLTKLKNSIRSING